MMPRVAYRAFAGLLLFLVLLYVGILPAAAQCALPSGWQTYTVARGDNLYRIALRFGTTVTTLQTGNCLSSTRINAGQVLYVPSGSGQPAPVPPNTMQRRTAAVTYQPYERGFMIWLSTTGDIWVYSHFSTDVKSRYMLRVHPIGDYAPLPDNTRRPPTGLVQPMFGFGKVWNSLGSYDDLLGWATQPETAYTLRYGILNGQLVEFNLPDGTTLARYSDGFWSAPGSPAPTPSAQYVIISQPSAQQSLLSGQVVNASGTAAGLFEATFILELRTVPGDTLLASTVVTYNAPDVGLAGPWQAHLSPLNYAGAAVLKALYLRPSDGTPVVLATTDLTVR